MVMATVLLEQAQNVFIAMGKRILRLLVAVKVQQGHFSLDRQPRQLVSASPCE